MRNTEILSIHIKEEIKDVLDNIQDKCLICGKDIASGVKKNKVLSAKFTNYSECKNLASDYICLECAKCIQNRDLRTNNFIADKNNLYLFKKQELEKYLFNLDKYISGEFVIGITTSFKKHNSFRTFVNYDKRIIHIREEDKDYILNINEAKKLYDILHDMYLFFTKDEMLSGNYSILKIEEFGLEKFKKCENEIKKHRNTHQLNLLVYMLDSGKRNEIVKERLEKIKEEKKNAKKCK